MNNPIAEISERMRKCDGHDIYWTIGSLVQTNNIIIKNSEELFKLLLEHSGQQALMKYWGPTRQSKQDAAFTELVRLTHNYFASAKTLVDHSRVISRKILRGRSFSDYESRVKSHFTEDPF